MKKFLTYAPPALALLGLTLGGCQPDIDTPKASAGGADFSRYIAVGNSLTAGYADNGLYLEGQQNSYPSILAQQFAQVGGGAFVQPLFPDANSNGSGYLKLNGFDATGNPQIVPVAGNAFVRPPLPLLIRYTGTDNQNLGVPGIRMSDINTAGYGQLMTTSNANNFNPYFERLLSGADARTYLSYVQERVATIKPTFFTEWLGNNDVLGYATAGGGANFITPTATFTTNVGQVLDALTTGGAKGVVATIPDVTGIPFFTTVGPSFRNALTASNVPGAAPFVYTTGPLAPGQANTRVTSTVGTIRDATGTGNLLLTLTASPYVSLYGRPTGKYWRDFYQQARPSLPAIVPNLSVFLLTLGVDTTKAFGQTPQNPFPSILVLDPTEQANVATATTAFNSALTSAANARSLALFDANAFFTQVARNGVVVNGVSNTASFVTGNLFGLDGVHPTPRGYALIANEMIRTINSKYGASISGVDATAYRGVKFP